VPSDITNFTIDLRVAIDAIGDKLDNEVIPELAKEIQQDIMEKSRTLLNDRLPGGPKAADAVYSKIKANIKKTEPHITEININYTHDWMKAIEYGTSERDVVAKYGGIGSSTARGVARELSTGGKRASTMRKKLYEMENSGKYGVQKRTNAPPSFVRHPSKEVRVPSATSERYTKNIMTKSKMEDYAKITGSEFYGQYNYVTKHVDVVKDVWPSNEEANMAGVSAHEAWHHVQDVADANLLRDSKSHTMVANLIENEAEAVRGLAMERIEGGETGTMTFTNTLKPKSGGKGMPPTPGYGTQYDTNTVYHVKKLHHPGSRQFRIVNDTVMWAQTVGAEKWRRFLESKINEVIRRGK